ncbi:protein peste-like isoform X1 [Trichoplusia ni]|uniref:Protein peste-like isoform X1 n=2 Tax=Trichoplusia ni TaxID=7111 RepID=A0A7E5VWV3_TRINI|nr:protein peste-like isoform X1 [Trichoplusia ni]
MWFRSDIVLYLDKHGVSPLPVKMRGRTPRWLWVGAGSGALLALAALTAALAWQSIFDSALATQLMLAPGSRSYQNWVAPTVPLYFDIYFFNWTNSERFPDEKPILEELGPYRFREKRRHVNITWHENNGTVAYRTERSWFFDEATSNGTLQDNITTLNVIAASAVYRSRFWGFLQQKGLSMGLAMFNQQIAISKLAKELLFDGYEDPLLDLAKSLPPSTTGGAPPVDRFGWFYERNNSLDTDGYMEVSTGQKAGTLPGQILRWNYEDHITYYEGECAKLSGSAGEFMPRNLTEESTLTMFVPDLCRTVNMDYVDSGELSGLMYHKYAISGRSFDNSTTSPSNTCFCNGECAWSGVMNVSACRFGSPAFLSLPHFLDGDPQLREAVEGMRPDPDAHSFYFAVEPRLGVPLDVSARFQLNIYIEPSPNVGLYQNVPRMLFPIFWVEQKVQINEEVIAELRFVRAIHDWGGTVCACAALVFAALVTMAACWARKPQYIKRELLAFEKPKDEAELKLNPI